MPIFVEGTDAGDQVSCNRPGTKEVPGVVHPVAG